MPPNLGDPEETRGYPDQLVDTLPAPRDELPRHGRLAFSPKAKKWEKAGSQEAEGRRSGPHLFTNGGKLFWNDEEPDFIRALRFGVGQGGKLRAVANLKMRDADRATPAPHSVRNPRPRGRVVRKPPPRR